MRALRALLKALEHPHAIRWIVALGVLLVLPVLGNGRVLDEHMQMLMATGSRGVPGLERAPWDLYAFMLDDAAWQATSRGAGFLPWYADPSLAVSFFRPLSSGAVGALCWLVVHAATGSPSRPQPRALERVPGDRGERDLGHSQRLADRRHSDHDIAIGRSSVWLA